MELQSKSDQADIVAFLMRPASYSAKAGEIQRVDTHGAMVFLIGDRAYKLKRAVKLPYFDFSTAEKRRRACERELTINRRTAPDLYLDLVPIRRDAGGGLRFGGEGEAIDWVVVMKRFPEEALLDRMSAGGQLDPALMPKLARVIRHFHRESEPKTDAAWLPGLAHIVETLEQTLLGEAAALDLAAAPYLDALRGELREQTPLLRERQAEGHVRRCHGDLHLKNIVLLDGEPVLFDAIEFDEDLATIDVLYDLAFLLMDLWHRGVRNEANAVLGAYFEGDERLSDLAGLRLLPFFLSLRAAIRAMVGVHALPVTPADRRSKAEQGVRGYTVLARSLLTRQPPALICVGGLSGTGKTIIARGLAPAVGAIPGAIHLRSDVERKLMFGVEPTSPLPPEAYGEDVGRRVYQHLLDKAAAILRAGHSAIIDARFSRPEHREAAARLVNETGASFRGLWLEASPEQMIARVEQRRNDASDAGREVVLQQLQSPPRRPGDWTVLDANGGPDQTLATAREACRLS